MHEDLNMSNLFESIKIETVSKQENNNTIGAEIDLDDCEEIKAGEIQICESEFNANNKNEEFAEGYIVMLTDGTFKILHTEDLVNENIAFPEESTSVVSSSEVNNELEALKTQIPCSYEGCDKTFISTSQLKAHQRKHNGMPPHDCDYCGKKFSTGYAVNAHKRTHTGEKPYICPELTCQKRFKTSGDLQKHIRTHTGERPFKCSVCSKAFTTSNIRKVHMRVHTGERPYQCTHEGCERRFSSATNYRNHLRIHTGEKPYVCSVQSCQRRFTEYSSLYKHYTVHSQKKRYECSVCSRQYRQLSTLNIHINTIHKDKLRIFDGKEEKVATHFEISNSECFEEKKDDDGLLFPSSHQPDSIYDSSCSSSSSSLKKDILQSPMDFEPIKAITCGPEAIIVLSVPTPSIEAQFQIDSDSNQPPT
ncbi:UNVERIFIED_CONTAM: hypothetical protein GTU68_000764 [Idotea baltica]|nr:hypothetical protein [Idotea baltica]